MEILDSIRNKLRDLLNLANNAGTVGEAEAAFAAAQKLMTKYKLSSLDVNNIHDKKKEPVGKGKSFFHSKNTSLWKEKLANILSRVNNCKFIISFGRDPRSHHQEIDFVLVGTDSNREITEYFFNSIVQQAERLCKTNQPKGTGKSWANNFKIGVCQTLEQRLLAAKKEAVKESIQENEPALPEAEIGQKTSQALILLNRESEDVEAWIKANMNLFDRKINHQSRLDISALEAGRKAGHKVCLNKGLSS